MPYRSEWNKGFFSYLIKDKKRGRLVLLFALMLLLVALLLSLVESTIGDKGEENEPTEAEELTSLLSSLEGVGTCEVYIRYGEGNAVDGIVVLCEGAERVQTRERVILLVSTFFHIGTNRIRVEKLK